MYLFINTVSILLKSKNFFPSELADNIETCSMWYRPRLLHSSFYSLLILLIKNTRLLSHLHPPGFCVFTKFHWTLVGAEWCVARGVKRPDVVNLLLAPVAVSPAPGQSPPSPAELHAHPHGEEPWPSRPDLAWPPCPDERQSNVPETP